MTHPIGPDIEAVKSAFRFDFPDDGVAVIDVPALAIAGVLQLLPDAAGISSLTDGRYIDVNAAMCALSGFTRDELVGHAAHEFPIWGKTAERQAFVQTLKLKGRVRRQLMTFGTRAGGEVHGLFSARVVLLNGAECMLFLFQEIHAEVEARRKLETSNALLNAACRIATIGVWEISPEPFQSYWSDTCYRIHGRDPALGMPPPPYIDTRVTLESREELRRCWKEALRDKRPWTVEMQIIRDDGKLRWVRDTGEPVVDESGKVVSLRGVMQDIDAERRGLEQQLEAHELFARLFQLMPDPTGITRASDGTLFEVNAAWESWLGYTRAEAIGQNAVTLGMTTAQERQQLAEAIQRDGRVLARPMTFRSKDGNERLAELSMRPIDWRGIPCWLFVVRDVTEVRRAERVQRERDELLALCAEVAELGVWDWNIKTGQVTGDARWRVHRAVPPEATSLTMDMVLKTVHPDDVVAGDQAMRAYLSNPTVPINVVRRIVDRDGHIRWVRNIGKVVQFSRKGNPIRMVGVTSDVTAQQEQQLELERLAHFDALTGLPNRVLLADRLRQATAQTDRTGHMLGVCYLDLDGFKPINDRYGHAAGDRVLIEVAKRLKGVARSVDTVARLGGDEFVILLADVDSRVAAEGILQRFMHHIALPYDIGSARASVTASMGLTLYPDDASDADTLLRNADQAMYQAKQAGRNRIHVFDAGHARQRHERNRELDRLTRALAAREFVLFVQPKVDMHAGKVVGAEALVRWKHPERGIIGPGHFLPQIEGSDLEQPFGDWVIDEGFEVLRRWHQAGLDLPLSLNVSARHLQAQEFVERVRDRLAQYPYVRAGQIELEITESGALSDLDKVADIVSALSNLGITIALDDFGTGYSSLSYLRRLPIDTLKVDQSFVGGMIDDHGDLAIVQGIIALARSFGRKVIAEGVETVEHGQWLVRMGCMLAQGYGVARPMPADDFIEWARLWSAPHEWTQTKPGSLEGV